MSQALPASQAEKLRRLGGSKARREIEYWKLRDEELVRVLNTSASGLDAAEAARRLRECGSNEIPSAGRRTAAVMLMSQLKNPLIYALVFAAAVASFLESVTEAAIIIAIVIANTLLGFAQEYKSEKAVDELRRYISYQAVVLRDGKKRSVDTKELVVGDLVNLAVGDVVPADIRLLEADEFQTNESVLTGESNPVDKVATPLELDSPLPHQLSNTALMGSEVMAGCGSGLVVATGGGTYFGRVASSFSLLPPKTDFQKNIARFGSFLVRLILILTVFVFIVNSFLGRGILEALLFSLALAVGIIPEALPVIITVGLSHGALRLVKKKVVVKRLEAIEDLGNVDVLCTDKTGTLTQNEITVQEIVDAEGGPRPELIKYALLCNSAIVEGDRILGNPIDVAIWKHARKTGFDENRLNESLCIHQVPFGFNRRRMSSIVESHGDTLLISKGAPEAILDVSTRVGDDEARPLSDARAEVRLLIDKYGQAGRRLIALGCRKVDRKADYSIEDERDLTFIGLLVLSDPLKEDAAGAISRLELLGIRLKILSGDDPVVTADVCRQLGIDVHDRVITGTEDQRMQTGDLRKAVEDTDVFGRVTPDQKFAIVEALRKNGHVVGFLGDGVNDAPALRLADAGISVDSGVQVAKEAASIILLEKSLGVIADGVAEGRRAFGNMMKYIMNTTSANFGNMFTVALASLFLPFMPLLPSQILLTNLVSDAPLLTISTDNLDDEGLRKPRRWNIRSIARFMLFFGLISTVFDIVTISSLVYLLGAGPELFRTGWFIESALSEIFVTFSIRTRRKFFKSRPSNLMILAAATVSAATVIIVYSPVGALFEFVPLPPWFLMLIFGILLVYFVLVEIMKHIFFSRYDI
ncbi:magnesium-translocating P-type ATPase [Candidatus Bathyarchaeota archaeon]|nr:magnesium-translocating P-type ATPase [Candidatus Bathyarchaeota archaeon]